MDIRERPERRWHRRPVFTVPLALALLVSLGVVLVGNNAFGRNISGEVTCASGAGVAGVFIEAERLPRAWPEGPDIQSGFATNRWNSANNVAEFTYWLAFGGRVSVHVGCGGDSEGVWASDNRTPFYSGDRLVIVCDDPGNPTTSQPLQITRDVCRRV